MTELSLFEPTAKLLSGEVAGLTVLSRRGAGFTLSRTDNTFASLPPCPLVEGVQWEKRSHSEPLVLNLGAGWWL